jgi:iron complex outermembrane receptor protein
MFKNVRFSLLFVFFVFQFQCVNSQQFVTVKITDSTNIPIPHAEVVLTQLNYHTISDVKGFFTIPFIQNFQITIEIYAIGYETKQIQLSFRNPNDTSFIQLHSKILQLTEVSIISKKNNNSKNILQIDIINDEFIRQYLGGSLMQTIERLPGIHAASIGSGQSKPMIRGLGNNRIIVLENGIKHEAQQWGTEHGLEIDQYSVSQMQIIKGPASIIYGSDAIGGIIDISHQSPSSDVPFGAEIDLSYKSNNNSFGNSLLFFGKNKKFFYNTRITYIDYADITVPTDSIHIYSYRIHLPNNKLRNTAGKEYSLHFNSGYIIDKFSSTLHVTLYQSKIGFFANAHGLEPRLVNTHLHDASNRDILLPSHDVRHLKIINRIIKNWGKHQTKFDIGFQNNYRNEWSQYVSHGYMPPHFPFKIVSYADDLEIHFNKHTFSANLREEISIGSHQISSGINSEFQNNMIDGRMFLIPEFHQYSAGAFLYDKIQFREYYTIHAGIRHDKGQILIQEYHDWFETPIIQNQDTVLQKLKRASSMTRDFQNTTYGLGIHYNNRHTSVRLNFGKSFRIPIAKELASNGINYHHFSFEIGDSMLNAELSYQLDLGLELSFDKWNIHINPFYNYFPNYIYLNPTSEFDYLYGAGNQVFYYTQSEVIRYGFEFQSEYKFNANFKINASMEYVYSQQISGAKKGFTLPFSPPLSSLFTLTYNPRIPSLNEPYISMDIRYIGKQSQIVPPESVTPSSQLFHISAGTNINFRQQDIRLNVQVQNLLNTRYLNHTSYYRMMDIPEPGRNLIISLHIPFTIIQNEHK